MCTIRSEFNRKSKWRKPETIKFDITDGIYVKLQRSPHIYCNEQHDSGTNVSTGRRQGEREIKDGGLQPDVDME